MGIRSWKNKGQQWGGCLSLLLRNSRGQRVTWKPRMKDWPWIGRASETTLSHCSSPFSSEYYTQPPFSQRHIAKEQQLQSNYLRKGSNTPRKVGSRGQRKYILYRMHAPDFKTLIPLQSHQTISQEFPRSFNLWKHPDCVSILKGSFAYSSRREQGKCAWEKKWRRKAEWFQGTKKRNTCTLCFETCFSKPNWKNLYANFE